MWNIPRKKKINFGGDLAVQESPRGAKSVKKNRLYVGFQVMSTFLEMRRLILLQKMAFLSLLLH